MANTAERIRIFEESMRLCRENSTLRSAVSQTIAAQKLYFPERESIDCGAPRFQTPAKRVLSRKRSYEAASAYAGKGKRVCVLNFASAMTPGGGVTRGATAQEESLCRISTLYPAISEPTVRGQFHEAHRALARSGAMNRRNNDDIIYSPDIVVFRADTFDCAMLPESEWYSVDVLSCAAPDLRYAPDGSQYSPSQAELHAAFAARITQIFRCAAANQADVLILGAFGCGAFRNPPDVVAAEFEKALAAYECYFETVEFAVYCSDADTRNFDAFAKISGIWTASAPQRPAAFSAANPAPLIQIDIPAVEKTAAFLFENGCFLSDADYAPEMCTRAEHKFGRGSGGICNYKHYKAAMAWIANSPAVMAMRYRYSAAAILTVFHGQKGAVTEEDFIHNYRSMLYKHMKHVPLDSPALHSGAISEKFVRLVQDTYKKTGAPEALSTLKVLKALEWNDNIAAAIKKYIDEHQYL